ncbi:AsmA-like C-terminal region-containing protein [Litoribacter populi]|uniref:AsmA-like C-terminal region-containing protein n=1 Tax=Litoribacter populi TaxID=2598460 RepID=UPI00117EC759|nr:AsmA-like C-terminal region-containing protein [Litoribacter populi]
MKKALIITGSIFFFIILVLIAIPFFFKDKILARIDQEIAASVNAQVYYDYDKVSLSLLRRFPNMSATIRDFGIRGNAPFENDTLMHVNSLQVDINLRSVLFDDYPELSGIHLLGGSMYVKVLEDGTANYDIAVDSGEAASEEPSEFRMGINLIEVKGLNLVYDDRELDFFMALANVDMEGEGDFTLDVYDLYADARADIIRVDYEGVNYLQNKRFKADSKINVDMDQMRFAFSEGDFTLNEFNFDLTGWLAMPTEAIEMDFVFGGKDNSFRSVLSLVPGIYNENFQGLQTSGTMDFAGYVRGVFDEQSMPSFEMALNVADGMFQYPDLPRPVSDVNMEMLVRNTTSDMGNTQVQIPVFRMKFGDNPVSGRLAVDNLRTYDMEGQLQGSLNLEEMTSIFPIEGTELRGMLSVDATAKGRYDSVANRIPAVNATMNLRNGYVRNAEYPAPIENLQVHTRIINTTGNMDDMQVDISQFGFSLEGETISGNMKVSDLKQLNWDGSLHGTVDLGKMLAIFPMENVIMEGRIRADIDTKGRYADVEAGRYDRVDTKGDVEIMNLYYTDLDLPQGVRIKNAKADFSPNSINLRNFDARLGQSPVTATGSLSNYIAYAMSEDQVLTGQLDIKSTKFDVNEWMTGGDETQDTTSLSVIELPRNIDFTMGIGVDEVLYDNLVLKNARGSMALKDGVLSLKDVATQTLGGQVTFNGVYDSRDIKSPSFDMNFNVNAVSIQEAFTSLNTVQAFAPIAQNVKGNFNTNFALSGDLGPNMMPVLSSLDGSGLIKIVQAAVEDSRLIQGITSLTQLKDAKTITFRDLVLSTRIEDGRLMVSPFNVRLWDYETSIEGSTGFDGTINYLLNMKVPAGSFGGQVNNLLSTISGAGAGATSTIIPVSINIGGSYQNPRLNLAGGNSIENLLTQAVRARVDAERGKVEDQLQQVQAEVVEQYRAKEDSLKNELKQKADSARDSVRREADRQVEEAKNKAANEAKNALRRGLGGFIPAKKDTSDRAN